jgi:hypothetical protein
MPSLSVRNAVLGLGETRIECDQIAGALTLQLSVESAQLRFSLDLASMKLSGVRLQRPQP